jgi:c-di-GMP-binding flagellar brake protein YcgR
MTGIIVLGIIVLILIVILILSFSEDYANSIGKRRGRLVTFTSKRIKERRKTLRLEASLSVKYQLLDEKKAPKISESRNISVGGAQLIIYEKLKKLTKIEMEIEIPYKVNPVKAIGEIVWLHEKFSFSLKQKRRVFFAGVKFIKINPHDEAKLLEYIYATLP